MKDEFHKAQLFSLPLPS